MLVVTRRRLGLIGGYSRVGAVTEAAGRHGRGGSSRPPPPAAQGARVASQALRSGHTVRGSARLIKSAQPVHKHGKKVGIPISKCARAEAPRPRPLNASHSQLMVPGQIQNVTRRNLLGRW